MVHVSIAAHLPWPTKVTFVHRLRGAPEASKAPTPAETPSGAGAEPRETQRLLALEVRNLGREIRWITTWDVSQTFQNNGISMDFNYQPQTGDFIHQQLELAKWNVFPVMLDCTHF